MIVCKNCRRAYSGKYCPKCGTEYIDPYVDSSDVLLGTETTDEDREAWARKSLWDAVTDGSDHSSQLYSLARELETFSRGDYLSRFAIFRCSESKGDLSEFLRTSEESGVEMYADVVLDYAIDVMEEKDSRAVGEYIKRGFAEGTESRSEYSEKLKKKKRELKRQRIAWHRSLDIYIELKAILISLGVAVFGIAGLICAAALCTGFARHWLVASLLLAVELYLSTLLKFGTEDAWRIYAPIAQNLMLFFGLVATVFFATRASLIYSLMFMTGMLVNGAYYLFGNEMSCCYAVSNISASAMFLVADVLLLCGLTGAAESSFRIFFFAAFAVFYVFNFIEERCFPDVTNCIHFISEFVMTAVLCFYTYFFKAGVGPALDAGICLLGDYRYEEVFSFVTMGLCAAIAAADWVKMMHGNYLLEDDDSVALFSRILAYVLVFFTLALVVAMVFVGINCFG